VACIQVLIGYLTVYNIKQSSILSIETESFPLIELSDKIRLIQLILQDLSQIYVLENRNFPSFSFQIYDLD